MPKKTDHALYWITRWNQLASPEIKKLLRMFGAEIRHQEHPQGELQVIPTRRWRFDWAVEFYKVAVEIDGGNRMVRWSKRLKRMVTVGAHTMSTDYEKRNAAAEAGWALLCFTTEMLKKDPQGCVDVVERTIRSRL